MQQLTPEQVRTMTLEEKDTWWLKNVYRGDMPQLTWRSAITGMFLGSILVLTNLYISIKTGFAVGVGITAVILSYAFWKLLSKFRLGKEMTILENNAMQSVATSAGYMGTPLTTSLVAYILITQKIIPAWQIAAWMIGISVLGVLYAFPLKKRFINDEQHPFPEGKACGLVMEGLHNKENVKDAGLKTKLLLWLTGVTMFYKVFSIARVMTWFKIPKWRIPDFFDDIIYNVGLNPTFMGIPYKSLCVRMESDPVMYAIGGLIGIRTGFSMLVGAVISYLVLAPIMMKHGVIQGVGFRAITSWALWGGTAMMTTASLLSFLSKPKTLLSSFSGFIGRKKKNVDVLKDIELPMKFFVIGIPIVGAALVIMGYAFFDIKIWLGIFAVPFVFVLTLIGVHSTALTSNTPVGAMGKLTQLTFAVIAPGNMTTNLMAASITADTSGNAANLLMDIKPGYMLGAKPRQQAIGHILGIIIGAISSTYLFYLLLNNDLSLLGSDKMPMPSGMVWKAVAEILSKGLSALHPTAVWAVVIGALLGIVLESIKMATKGKFFLSPVAMGLAFVIPFWTTFSIFLGSLFFWVVEKMVKDEKAWWKRVGIPNQETICAGLIAGGSIMGMIGIILDI